MKVLKVIWFIIRLLLGGILSAVANESIAKILFPEYYKREKK